jgi:hypothetical protein
MPRSAAPRRSPDLQIGLPVPSGVRPAIVSQTTKNRAGRYSCWTCRSDWSASLVSPEIASSLPQCCRMEVQARLFHQLTEIDVRRPTKTIPARKTVLFLALDIGERIADVLKIETDTASFQLSSFATPPTEKVAVRALTRLMAVRAAESFFWCLALQIQRHYQRAKARASQKSNAKHSRVHSGSTTSMSP